MSGVGAASARRRAHILTTDIFRNLQSMSLEPNQEQGLQMNQEITFMTDGEDCIRSMTEFMSPCAEHVLYWFHLTMRITVLGQFAKGLAGCHHDKEAAEETYRTRGASRGSRGTARSVQPFPACVDDPAIDLVCIENGYPNIKALRKGVREIETCVANNAHAILNCAERHRYRERVATTLVESRVNTVVGRRFSKKKQMR